MTNFDRKNVIQEIADSYVNRSLFSGIEWVAEKSGKIVLSGKSGYQNFEQKKSIPENAIYRIYSMTKPITSVMALKLIERGKLRLYDPVSSFIPSFEKLKVMNPDGSLEELNRPMIIEDLLTHRSGFTYDFLMGCHVAPLYSERDISDNGKKSLEEIDKSLLLIFLSPGPSYLSRLDSMYTVFSFNHSLIKIKYFK